FDVVVLVAILLIVVLLAHGHDIQPSNRNVPIHFDVSIYLYNYNQAYLYSHFLVHGHGFISTCIGFNGTGSPDLRGGSGAISNGISLYFGNASRKDHNEFLHLGHRHDYVE
ncbi:hypothetical protein DERF_011569, partial [Dermatophagoides farinae]